MRVLAGLFALTMCMPATAADIGHSGHLQFYSEATGAPVPTPGAQCRRTTSYLAGKSGAYRGKPLTPRKLTELPPARGYMAVVREIGGCDAPLTMVEYRTAPRR